MSPGGPIEPARGSPGAIAPGIEVAALAGLGSLELRARKVMEGFLHGLHGSPFHGSSVEFTDYRAYQPGDDLRHLDWRLYARCDRLCVKRFEHETNARCLLLVDTSASMAYRGSRAPGSKLDTARVVALALGWLLIRQNDAVGLLSLVRGDDGEDSLAYLAPSQKSSQRGILLGRAGALSASGEGGLGPLLGRTRHLLRRRSLIFLLSDFLEEPEALEPDLERLRFEGHEVLALQCLDPDEIDFPFVEGTLFEDLENGRRRQLGEGAAELYRSRFAAFMECHRAQLRRLEIPHLELRSDQDPGRVLGRWLAARARR